MCVYARTIFPENSERGRARARERERKRERGGGSEINQEIESDREMVK